MIGYDSYRAACSSPPDTLDMPECACGDELAIGPHGLFCALCAQLAACPDCDGSGDVARDVPGSLYGVVCHPCETCAGAGEVAPALV